MFQFIMEGGIFMILLIIIFLGIIVLSIIKTIDLFVKKEGITIKDEIGINAILFWGCICALIGILAQLMGLYLAINEIAMAKDISPQIVLTGVRVSFNTTILGLLILLLSSITWFFLKIRFKKIIENN